MSHHAILDQEANLFMGEFLSAVFPTGTQVALGGKRRGLRHVARRDERGRIYSGWVRSDYIRFCDDQSVRLSAGLQAGESRVETGGDKEMFAGH